ncbi:hypothetical protein SFRURICE_021142 [Spodoptera frugiperda]|nr:hypothetical protein SFRURICE_021142 [Spodoptera frugiperda]
METGHLLVVCAAVLGAVQAGQHDIYSGHSVYGVHVRSKAHQMLLHDLEPILDLDVWQHGIVSEREAFIRVAPENKELFLNALEEEGIEHYVHLEDVAQDLEERDNELKSWRASKQNRLLFQDYPRHEEVNAYMDRIALQHPDLATVVTAGKSFEGRDIKYIKISTSNFEDSSKPIYMLTAMIHAREWVTTPTLLYSMHRLVENLRSQDQDLREDIDWIIMPLLNPDGYEYSHTTDRLWRKTRSYRPDFNDTCWGVDGNRNYDSVHFGVIGASADPCNVTYPGPEPFSEVETAYVRDVLLENVDRIQLFMDVHSFGNYITYGYGDGTLPPNVVELHLMSSVMGAAFDVKKLPEANFYRVGNSGILMYPTAGCAQDYAQSIGIPFSLTLELPSYGHGFVVPPQYINHINDETWHGIAESARLARTFHRNRHSVYGVHVRSKAHQMLLHDLEPILDLDVWQHGIVSEREAFIRVAPENKELFLNALEEEGIEHYVHLEDVAQDLEERDNELKSWRASKQNRMAFEDYPRHDQVNAYMDRIALQHPDLATVVTAGKSFEGRDIKYIKISTSNFEDSSKPIYMLTAMIHAREWVTTPTLLYSMHRLVENLRSQDQDLREDIDWIIMPLLNPDGYEYSHTTDRLWRKTRSYRPDFNDTCWGVDGNRNYDSVNFGVIGASIDPCNVTYPGPEPFSEVETAYVRDVLLEHVDRIQLFMDVHSFGNYITYGYGDGTLPPNVVELHLMSSVMGSAIDVHKLPEAAFYRVGNSGILMYPTAGCAQDYAQSIGVPFSLTLELPSYGQRFEVSPQYINHINEETWQGIAASARVARTFYKARTSAPTTDRPTDPSTDSSTYEPTKSTTYPPTETTTYLPTETTTNPATETTTNPPTETTTNPPTETTTYLPTETTTNPPTETTTYLPTETTTNPATETTTNPPTETTTYLPTKTTTYLPTESTTNPPTETTTNPPTETTTDLPTETTTNPPTETTTYLPTETTTYLPTESTTNPPTETTTNPPTETTTYLPTETTTNPPTESTTNPATESTTNPATESTTIPPTESTTNPPTESTTNPPTESTTNPATESTTNPATESTTNPT